MLKRFIGLNNLFLFIFSIFFQNPINAKIGDKYSCKDYANTYYERGSKFNRDNYNFFLQWEKNKILTKFDGFPNIYSLEIVQQDSNSFVAWEYDKIGKSGITIETLDETDINNILYIRTHVDSKSKVTSSWFSKCKKI
jgi:hypothetical protein